MRTNKILGAERPPAHVDMASLTPPLARLTQARARLALFGVLLGTLLLAFIAPGIARPFFILGSAGVGYLAWREGCGRSVEAAITLYVFAPFLRRVVDLGIGFDPSGVMLVGPVLAIAIPAVELRHLLIRQEKEDEALLPLLLVGACITYGMLLSAFSGEFGTLGTTALKMYMPLLYAAWIMRSARNDPSVLEAATRTLFVLSPILGVYAVWQYVSPADWDRYWMLNVTGAISVLGRPEPYQVRVFSMMNSPASFGTYAACGLLLSAFCLRGWKAPFMALLLAPGLLFTYYRTAWISLVLGIVYCALFNRTRKSAGLVALALVVVTILAAGSADFGDAVMQRLETLTGSISDDGSGKARLGQLFETYRLVDEMGFGLGFARLSTPFNGIDTADGEVVTAIIAMGVIVGSIYLLGLVWAGTQAVMRISSSADPKLIVTGGVIIGLLAAIPLTGVTSGEIGVLFWVFIALATAQSKPQKKPSASSSRTISAPLRE
jgi:hypothetical protein